MRTLRKEFNGFTAVDEISFAVEEGTALSLLGPSGCGKTTTLRCIAGLEAPDSGEISIAGDLMSAPKRRINVPPEKRGLGMVFQSYAIWPHMTVFDNVAFGLRTRSVPSKEIRPRVLNALAQTRLHGLENRFPSELSGGQQQRVALARALVYAPKVLLMDEPLSNLDARLREQTRVELRQIQDAAGITTIYVTHDQQEALAISDLIAVMSNGKILQIDRPDEIYNHPTSRFVAEFVGKSNVIRGHVLENSNGHMGSVRLDGTEGDSVFTCAVPENLMNGDKISVIVRPESLHVKPPSEVGENAIRGQIAQRIFLGNFLEYHVECGENTLVVQSPSHFSFEEGSNVSLWADPNVLVVLPEDQ